ncbi:MAG: DUF481 domain-containing protein [Pirellulales bacterium]|nr:DUF481 domain-containing protein [Pirellulales bacterium]
MAWFARIATILPLCGWLLVGPHVSNRHLFADGLMDGDPIATWGQLSPAPRNLTLLNDLTGTTGTGARGTGQTVSHLAPAEEETPDVFYYHLWHSPEGGTVLLPPLSDPPSAGARRLPGAVKIPFEILKSQTQKKSKAKKQTLLKPPVTLHPDTAIASTGNAVTLGEVDKATFKTELEILESQWNVDFNVGMQETGEDGNRVRLGTIARYRTPEQLLKIDMDFERSQGEEESVANHLRLGTLARYRWKGKELEFDMKYERRQDEQENVTNRVMLDGTQEWFFSSTRWSHYLGGKVEYDQLEAFDSRVETNTGFAYSLLKSKASHVKVKAGTTVARELGVEQEEADLLPESLYGLSINQNVTDAQQVTTSLDYMPSWKDFQQYEVKAEANWQLVLDEETDFRLQVGARNRFDSTVPIESIDDGIDYTTSLMWVY